MTKNAVIAFDAIIMIAVMAIIVCIGLYFRDPEKGKHIKECKLACHPHPSKLFNGNCYCRFDWDRDYLKEEK